MMNGLLKQTLIDFSPLAHSVLLAALFFVCGAACMAMEERSERRVVGGPCQYREYPGRAVILSVQKQEGQTHAGEPAADVYEVKFSFTPDKKIEEGWVQVEGKEHLLLLINSSLPGPGFLKKYGIERGKGFDCNMKVITKGTCTPVLFEFPAIDLSDYSERE
jgi:hypothetical protein